MAVKWTKTSFTGVRYYEHPTRRNGKRPDRYFSIRWKCEGQSVEEGLGWSSEGWTAEKASLERAKLKEAGKTGEGPRTLREKRAKARQARLDDEARQRKEITVARLIEEYVERYAKRQKKSWQEDLRALNKDILPAWGDLPAKEITRRDVVVLLEKIVERGAPIQANNVMEKVRRMFNVAVKWGYLENSPVFGVDRPAPKTERDRSLSEVEIRKLWLALDREEVQMSDEIRRALKLILVTAQRPGEVIGLHRNEIDGQWWTIPANRSKNGRPHRVFLTELVIELIGTTGGYIFPSPTGKGPIAVNAVALTLRRNIKGVGDGKKRKRPRAIPKEPAFNRIGIEFFRPHDLRRTAVTGMAALRIPWEVRERVVNHTLGRLEKIYNQHDYDDEKRLALQKWTNKLKAVIFGQETKVVVLRQGRRQRSDSQG